ncbi:hypothetical protein [Arthrobacter sp. FW306-06-A]|uniref:hypothetical protein n=1 Tax=Arthrobacter sp. FW306-06-A TaxID=2879621 RepID=UPI001F1DF250|nr:hypothetical protein [Arthrobacter sp. FW306-06-A]UKA73557.1 hypothetical protein LFT49_22430 [Arthrobacter sp. FW306-06-A]
MTGLPGESEAGAKLKRTALRDFEAPLERNDPRWRTPTYKLTVSPTDAPVPVLLRYALTLIGLTPGGPDEKVAWWVGFTYKGEPCTLAHEKFGVRLYLRTDRPEVEARQSLSQVIKKLQGTSKTVERLILDAAPDILGIGDATVLNQHYSLRRAYDYFRVRAESPDHIEDEMKTGESPTGKWTSFKSGEMEMQLNSFHDMIAAISAFLSLLEHDLVLALPFGDFDPEVDNVTNLIGARWGDKWDRVLGHADGGGTFRRQLTEVVERWRNPYSHGGFEKGHGATIWLHTPGVGAAVPVGLTRVRESPHFSFIAARESDIAEVFALFDQIDAWLSTVLPEAMEWIESGLDVRYDNEFRSELAIAKADGNFTRFLEYHVHRQDMINNMDY